MGRTAFGPPSTSPPAGDAARAPQCATWRLYLELNAPLQWDYRQGWVFTFFRTELNMNMN